MSTMTPKNPVPLLLGLGVLLVLASRRSASAATRAATATPVPVRTGGVDYANPTAAAEVVAQLVNRMTRGVPVKADPTAQGVTEAARTAVRAGDAYYGSGAIAWSSGNAEAARLAVREADPYYSSAGWTAATVSTPDVPASSAIAPAAPVYDPAEDADRWAGMIPADVLREWGA